MQNWTTFLEQQGARAIDPDTGAIGAFDGDDRALAVTDFMAPLTGHGLIAASGADAVHFLHNQLTNDVEKLDTTTVRLAGYCTPKGRLLATFLLWKSAESVFLQLPAALRPAIQKRLQMFVLRAKVTLADAGQELAQLGLVGPAATTVLARWFPTMPSQPYGRVDGAAGALLRLADVPAGDGRTATARYLWVAPPSVLEEAWPILRTALTPAGDAAWRLTDIRAGVPTITLPTQDQFVPQMINFEAVGGVNFQKGCYPGQEIVARSQYLGKLKRRMLPATIAAAPTTGVTPGMEVFSTADPEQACGMIVDAVRVGDGDGKGDAGAADGGSYACLVEIKLAAVDATVHLGRPDGALLRFEALPYALSDAERPALR